MNLIPDKITPFQEKFPNATKDTLFLKIGKIASTFSEGSIIRMIGDDGTMFLEFELVKGHCPHKDNKAYLHIDCIKELTHSEWIDWNGGDMPVPEGTLVDVEYRDRHVEIGIPAGKGKICGHERGAIYWGKIGGMADIVKYRLHIKPENTMTYIDLMETRLQLMKAKVAEMEAAIEAAKIKKWEPEGGDFLIKVNGRIALACVPSEHKENARKFGTLRKTEEQAKKAAEKMRKVNRLLAYVDEACGGYDFVAGSSNTHVLYDHRSKAWVPSAKDDYEVAGAVYMPREVARELVKKLNSGEVVL
jgi:hypothetical protein